MKIENLINLTSQELIERLEKDGLSRNAIAAGSGVTQPQIQRAATGERELRETNYRLLLGFAVLRLA